MMVQCIWRQMFPCLGLEDRLLLVHFTTEDLLTIIPRARMGSESRILTQRQCGNEAIIVLLKSN